MEQNSVPAGGTEITVAIVAFLAVYAALIAAHELLHGLGFQLSASKNHFEPTLQHRSTGYFGAVKWREKGF